MHVHTLLNFQCATMLSLPAKSDLELAAGELNSQVKRLCFFQKCASNIVQALPYGLRHDIATEWNLNERKLEDRIISDILSGDDDFIGNTLRGIYTASRDERYLCWLSPLPKYHHDFAEILGALSASLVTSQSIDSVPQRLPNLPHGQLQEGVAHCISDLNFSYERAIQHLQRYRTDDGKNENPPDIMTTGGWKTTGNWTGISGLVLPKLFSNKFECTSNGKCLRFLSPSWPYKPASGKDLVNKLLWLMERNQPFCFSLGKIKSFKDRPTGFWIHSDVGKS